jgi:hypothetical protein
MSNFKVVVFVNTDYYLRTCIAIEIIHFQNTIQSTTVWMNSILKSSKMKKAFMQ